MNKHQVRTEPHTPVSDDVGAWIVIGLLAGAVALAVWLPVIIGAFLG